MLEDREYLEMCCLNSIENVCRELDFLSDVSIEEGMFCSFDCCIGNSRCREIFENPSKTLRDMLGDSGLKLTYQLDEFIMRGIERVNYGEIDGFSKTQEWLDFIATINKINLFLKDVLKKHGRDTLTTE